MDAFFDMVVNFLNELAGFSGEGSFLKNLADFFEPFGEFFGAAGDMADLAK
ncbi:hypothetical protein [Corynebacterium sp. 13CS0277]|uniref:hypothetical protein n=1 Tax=Corynebacterium sp. 13CS0277 TaxID=2071994 RepID=UPI001304F43F|nr:hypothetical protein [Corynebacterium sp. 13CS0277]